MTLELIHQPAGPSSLTFGTIYPRVAVALASGSRGDLIVPGEEK